MPTRLMFHIYVSLPRASKLTYSLICTCTPPPGKKIMNNVHMYIYIYVCVCVYMYNYKYSLLGLFLSGLTINGSSCWIYLYWMDGCIFKFMEREKHLRCLPCIESCFQLAARFLRQSSMKTSGSSDYQRVLNSMHKTIILYLDYI